MQILVINGIIKGIDLSKKKSEYFEKFEQAITAFYYQNKCMFLPVVNCS